MAPKQLNLDEIKHALAHGQCHFSENPPKILGNGCFGGVVAATHQVSQKHYAVKLMIYDPNEVKYHKRELELLTKLELSHRNVIRYFNSWIAMSEDKKVLCIQMELCLTSLGKWLLAKPFCAKNPRFYLHVFPQILNGLDAIHSIGWVHRDVHPENILIANPEPGEIQDMEIKLADFGLARKLSCESSGQTLSAPEKLEEISPNVGNELFRAPEMSKGPYDCKVDLFSAGIVLYILSCKLPREPPTAELWNEEIKQLRLGKRDGTNLHHKDEMLRKLIFDLMHENPESRPNACEALERFSTQEVDNGDAASPKPCVKFLVRRGNEPIYTRGKSMDQTFTGVTEAIENLFGIAKDSQIVCQEIKEGGENSLVGIYSDVDVTEMVKSAEDRQCRIKLVVLTKDSPDHETEL